jgi:excisionase family DNA binding protein
MRDVPPEPEHYLTRAELARILGVSKDTVKRLEKRGLPRVVFGERLVR